MNYEEDNCAFCGGKFVGRGADEYIALADLTKQLDAHEQICLMRYSADKKNKKR